MFKRSSSSIYRIRDYAEALHREENIKPIRGTSLKPIGPRRYNNMLIRKDADANIHCRLYDTDVVTFKPDGEIVVRINGWASTTTTEFASAVLGETFVLIRNHVWVKARWPDDSGGERGDFPLLTHGENLFSRRDDGRFRILNPQIHKVHRINRAGANNVRARYASFRSYVIRMCKLRGAKELFEVNQSEMLMLRDANGVYPPMLRVLHNYKIPKDSLAEFQRLITDNGEDKTQDFYRAFMWLIHGSNFFRAEAKSSSTVILKLLDEVTYFIHRDEVFDKVSTPGDYRRDNYSHFFDI